MVKAAMEIQMENPREAETHSAGGTCSPSEEQAEKPSMLCFKKRKKSRKKGQCVSTDLGQMKVSNQPRSSRGAWTAIKNLTRPRRRQKSSSRKKVPSDSQVQLEVDVEEGCAQGIPKKRVCSGVKMPCVRFSRGKKKPSPSEAVEESEGSVQEDQDMAKESTSSVDKSEPLTEPTPDAEERTECTIKSEITDSETVNETSQEKLQEESPPETTVPVEGGEVAPEVPISKDQPDSAPETTELQEIPNICEELSEGNESEKSINLPEECKAEETIMDFSQSASKDDAVSMEDTSSHEVPLGANIGTAVGIVITITEAEDSDNTDSDQGPEAGGDAQAEEKAQGDHEYRTGEQYELLLIETASSLVKAAIQSSIEQLVNEMALEQNKHNSFL
uniref:Uncharacterized protein n=1 Tax=Melopsittacus undulatus TaxID=13146 RepID=A0A8C6IS84_MELUD